MGASLMAELICDFCSKTPVRWRYPARDFTRHWQLTKASVTATSHGDWAACDHCHGIIRRGDREALAEHSLATMPDLKAMLARLPPQAKEIAKAEMRRLHDDFWASRDGAPAPIPVSAIEAR